MILVASAAATSRRQQSSTSHPVAGAAPYGPYHIDTCAARRAEPQPARRERWQGEQAQLSNSASRPTGRFRPHGVVTVTVTVHDMTRRNRLPGCAWLRPLYRREKQTALRRFYSWAAWATRAVCRSQECLARLSLLLSMRASKALLPSHPSEYGLVRPPLP